MSRRKVTVHTEKLSVLLDKRKTSISLEPIFIRELRRIAESGGRTPSALISVIRQQYPGCNVSSAVRQYVLAEALAGRPQ